MEGGLPHPPNQEAETVAKKLVDEFICRFSIPKQLHSDQGRQFESQLVTQVCKLLHIAKSRTTPYHPQSNGLIERFNRTLIQLLATCTEEHPFHWEEYLCKVCMAYNTSKQSTTGYSPFYLMFGRNARLPIDVMYVSDNQGQNTLLLEYVRTLQATFAEVFECVRANISKHQERKKETHSW